MRRFIFGACSTLAALTIVASLAPGCGSDSGSGSSSGTSGGTSGTSGCVGFGCDTNPDAGDCVNLCQNQVTCETPGVTTTLSGTVLDPKGKVPIYNATVYVPNGTPDAIVNGPTCDRCDAKVSGSPLVITNTNVEGKFK